MGLPTGPSLASGYLGYLTIVPWLDFLL